MGKEEWSDAVMEEWSDGRMGKDGGSDGEGGKKG
jgi:hypothetical protein